MFKQVFLFRWYLNTSSKLRKTKGEFQHKTKHHDSQRSTMIHYETHPVFLSCFLSMYCMLWTLNKLSIIFLTTMTKVWNTVKQKWLLKVPAGFKFWFSNAVKAYSNYSWVRRKGMVREEMSHHPRMRRFIADIYPTHFVLLWNSSSFY
jgi:hypothetical protein